MVHALLEGANALKLKRVTYTLETDARIQTRTYTRRTNAQSHTHARITNLLSTNAYT